MSCSVKLTPFGLELSLTGHITDSYMEIIYKEVIMQVTKAELDTLQLYVDATEANSLTHNAKIVLSELYRFLKLHALERSAVVVSEPCILTTLKEVSTISGIFRAERCFDTSLEANWYKLLMHWILDGKEPPILPGKPRYSRYDLSQTKHIFLRYGKGWQMEISIDDSFDIESFQRTLVETNCSIQEQADKYGIQIVAPKETECNCVEDSCSGSLFGCYKKLQ